MIKFSKLGSEAAIKVVKNHIPAALDKLKGIMGEVKATQNNAIGKFSNQTKEILDKITGLKAANFIQQKTYQQHLLELAVLDRENHFRDLADKQG